jgi:transposase InsO family protein
MRQLKRNDYSGVDGAYITDRPRAGDHALLMAVWRHQPTETVMVHSDQDSHFTSYEWQDFCEAHNLQQSKSRRGNCHENAVAESFFQLLKCEKSSADPTQLGKKDGQMCLTTSKCFLTQNVAIIPAAGFHQQTTRSSIPKAAECLGFAGRFRVETCI